MLDKACKEEESGKCVGKQHQKEVPTAVHEKHTSVLTLSYLTCCKTGKQQVYDLGGTTSAACSKYTCTEWWHRHSTVGQDCRVCRHHASDKESGAAGASVLIVQGRDPSRCND